MAKRERERSTRKQAATMSVVTVATDQVGVSASDRPFSAAIPASATPARPSRLLRIAAPLRYTSRSAAPRSRGAACCSGGRRRCLAPPPRPALERGRAHSSPSPSPSPSDGVMVWVVDLGKWNWDSDFGRGRERGRPRWWGGRWVEVGGLSAVQDPSTPPGKLLAPRAPHEGIQVAPLFRQRHMGRHER